jgi:hypothetical protein
LLAVVLVAVVLEVVVALVVIEREQDLLLVGVRQLV